jgi:uncharacterized protein
MSLILVSALTRMFQGMVVSAPTLLTGLLIAAVLRYYLGPAETRRLFGGESIRGLPQAWLIGMLLPVCSIGVLPILRELHRARVRPGAMTAFALSAPLFNPLSLLYGLTLSRPIVIISFALASLVLVTLLGTIWDRCSKRETSLADDADPDTGEAAQEIIGLRRMVALLVFSARELVGPSGVLALIALSGLGILGAALPYGALQSSFEMNDTWAPARMALLAVPVYATPMMAMGQLGMMFVHSNSPGAALAMLLLGAGMNLATLYWFVNRYGFRALSVWFVSLISIVLVVSYAIDRPLILPGAEPAGHTHAFDVYATPFAPGSSLDWAMIRDTATRRFEIFEVLGIAMLGLLAALGLVFHAMRWDETRFQGAGAAELPSYDRIVPRSVLGLTMLGGLIAFSIVGCFAYYPPAKVCLEEISVARGEAYTAARSGNVEHALHWIEQLEDWSRKLEVGTFLRKGEVRPYQRMQGKLIRKKLELLEHELEHQPIDQDEINEILRQLFASDQRWRDAFR